LINSYQATCEDGWKSDVVKADSKDKAADMLQNELMMHVRQMHNLELPEDPNELHKTISEHVTQVM
jgi:hypothetical protein